MAIPPKQIDEKANRRSGLRVIGSVLVLLSIGAVAYGIGQLSSTPVTPSDFTQQMNDATNSGNSFTGFVLIGGGAIGMLIGFSCFTSTIGREDVSVRDTGSGTCPACGLLNEPGARTCEGCGAPLAR
ncbi:hypothetical protein Back2_12290 [Nocardioides baekrokdamisoli]|uniref:RanBP2-type domain-containing protein n=1 Tax=Nocardioides baekrokdamisoli TaxID=1804624 RepID=A0A3G9IF54_9ACTN|nr:zinc ribbon domain-containing protein [Nocardioides baekrokdamisoli]BBH16942.1 hypothetical protein Back2_12290 [Nocardioides baekrokdamisoli]